MKNEVSFYFGGEESIPQEISGDLEALNDSHLVAQPNLGWRALLTHRGPLTPLLNGSVIKGAE